MIVELGHFTLILAFVFSITQAAFGFAGATAQRIDWINAAKIAAQVQFLFTTLAFAALTYAYVISDFSVRNVFENSHTLKPLIYKISGVWGNHEGSMLLWVLVLALFGAAVARFGDNLPSTLRARVLGVQALIGIAFLAFILATSNPFERIIPAPVDGQGLNPLLQDPGLALHPPILYVGYVGFSVAFSFAIAALIEGNIDASWARWVRPWTLLAWSFLTGGIALGSWWAYYELGWGGWWYWDPVENASLMPWLIGTALLHSSIVVEKRDSLKSWTILLSILTFALSLIGTFLVRSGVLTSVHTFATDPDRGVFILGILCLAIGGGLALYAWRAPYLKGGKLFQPISREGGVLLNNLLLTTAAATVFLGTIYPLVLEVFNGSKISVGPPYFNATFVPLMAPLVAALAVGPLLGWKRGDIAGALSRLKATALTAITVFIFVAWTAGQNSVWAALGIFLAVWLAGGVITELAKKIGLGQRSSTESWRRLMRVPRSSWGMSLAHFGLAVFIIGATGLSFWKEEKIILMQTSETTEIANYKITFNGVRDQKGPNYIARQAIFTVQHKDKEKFNMTAEKRRYPVSQQETTEAGIKNGWLEDLYIVIGTNDGKNGQTVRIYLMPLVSWIWMGVLIMVLGGLFSLTDRRFRIGIPERRKIAGPSPVE
ncbi:MAG: heme lyase NrfEFG subunit NrfE [Rhodospirillaceae bacterium]|nr:heme lyase NrfEFG subunit NrfE [Rhodospirillaceae bacterium]|tara:strand:+ start:548 stop:2527 length:1980 start_codon:yes stop_codon:yes gene_type:complete